jgi:hypothetical protein
MMVTLLIIIYASMQICNIFIHSICCMLIKVVFFGYCLLCSLKFYNFYVLHYSDYLNLFSFDSAASGLQHVSFDRIIWALFIKP